LNGLGKEIDERILDTGCWMLDFGSWILELLD